MVGMVVMVGRGGLVCTDRMLGMVAWVGIGCLVLLVRLLDMSVSVRDEGESRMACMA